MKLNAGRYGLTTMMCCMAVSFAVIAAEFTETKWLFACIGSVFSGFLCAAIVPFEQKGD